MPNYLGPVTAFYAGRQDAAQAQQQQQEMALRSADSERRNALFKMDEDRFAREGEDRQMKLDDRSRTLMLASAANLADLAENPQAFEGLKARIFSHPEMGKILGEYGVTPDQVTPESVGQLLAQSRAGAGVMPPQSKDLGQLYKIEGQNGPQYTDAGGAMGQRPYNDPNDYGQGQAPSDQRLYEWLSNQSPEDQQAFLEMRRGYAGPEGARDLEAAKYQGRAVGGAQGERDVAFEGDLAKIDDEIARNNRLINEFKAGKYQTGYIAGMLPNYRTAAQDLSREQGKDVIGAISSATFGALSEGEREFLRNLGISESNTEESNINLLTLRGIELKRARDRLAGRKSLVPSGPSSAPSGGPTSPGAAPQTMKFDAQGKPIP